MITGMSLSRKPAKADVAIEFLVRLQRAGNIEHCFEAASGSSGTTGWYDEIDRVRSNVGKAAIRLIYASNFSVGCNIFFHVNRVLQS